MSPARRRRATIFVLLSGSDPERPFLFTGDSGRAQRVPALRSDVLVTQGDLRRVIEVFKRTGAWQTKTEGDEKGGIPHMEEELVSREGQTARWLEKADIKTGHPFVPTIGVSPARRRIFSGQRWSYCDVPATTPSSATLII